MSGKSKRPKVVHLVDNKRRDLLVAGLIAHQLDALGVDCALEPLEATQAVLAAHEPDAIVFNHLSASHLAAYSQRLKDLGVLVAILPNEGLVYKPEVLDFLALKSHQQAHIDLYFCWNEPFAEAVRRNVPDIGDKASVIGVPRFDFYKEPWSRLYGSSAAPKAGRRPRILVCTNFVFAKYKDLPAFEAEKIFGSWAKNIPTYQDYRGAIDTHHANRARLFDFLAALLATDLYDVVLRPHPNEEAPWYAARIAEMPEAQSRNLTLEADRNITEMILECDLEISMDSCTTALESWIAGKPTIDLDMLKHPILTNEIVEPLNVHCADPADLQRLVAEALAEPTQSRFTEIRRTHLAKWCDAPDGTSARKMAEALVAAIAARGPRAPLGPRLSFKDKRKALKLAALRLVDLPYNWLPLLALQGLFDEKGTYMKRRIYDKTMRPSDVTAVRQRIRTALAGK